jgi:pilus assembly protein CpaB
VLLVVAVVAGILAAVLAGRFLGAKAEAAEVRLRERYEPRAVVVAAKDLPQGTQVDTSLLAVRKMPREYLPADAVPEERATELIGAHTAIGIRRGTPVVAAALRQDLRPPRLAAVLAGEQRALTIAVDQMNSQAGNLLPGDWVDLYYSRTEGGGATIVPLLQRVGVLATGAALRPEEDSLGDAPTERNYSTITLALSATDAARVVLAQQSGNLSVVLRSPDDRSQLSVEPRSSRELLRRPVSALPAPGSLRIEVLVGGEGGLTPRTSWLTVGQRGLGAEGDAS